jgi:hypothetical protein
VLLPFLTSLNCIQYFYLLYDHLILTSLHSTITVLMTSQNPFFPSDLDVESQSPPSTLTESPQPEISRHDYASPSPTPTVHSGGNGDSGDSGNAVPDGTQQSKFERPGAAARESARRTTSLLRDGPPKIVREGSKVAKKTFKVIVRELFLDVRNDSIAMAVSPSASATLATETETRDAADDCG